ncbi:hypothetical protein ACROYT_G014653 [Oculina patagonica]
MSLCALHCEKRYSEQLLKSIGLLANQIASLNECNSKLSEYGPSNFKGDRITVKPKPGQETAPGRNYGHLPPVQGLHFRPLFRLLLGDSWLHEHHPMSNFNAILASSLGTNDLLFPPASLSSSFSNSLPAGPGFNVGPGRLPIPAIKSWSNQ